VAGRRASAHRVSDPQDFIEDLDALVEQARGRHPGLPVVLIGHSMGGLIAARYAQLHPDKLSALVLSAPVIGANEAFAQLLTLWIHGEQDALAPLELTTPAAEVIGDVISFVDEALGSGQP
jgi:alpha-beta hydrolase superfamily lysophospholipase